MLILSAVKTNNKEHFMLKELWKNVDKQPYENVVCY